jgi:hypothetical protein
LYGQKLIDQTVFTLLFIASFTRPNMSNHITKPTPVNKLGYERDIMKHTNDKKADITWKIFVDGRLRNVFSVHDLNEADKRGWDQMSW